MDELMRSEESCDLIDVIDYNADKYDAYTVSAAGPDDFSRLADIPGGCVRWINLDGPCREQALEQIGRVFHIHPLVIRNIPNSSQRAKIEEYQNFLHIVVKMISYKDGSLNVEHMNFLLGANYVITFGEMKGDVFDDIRSRIQNEGAHARTAGADFLLYLLLDAIVEGYFDVLETLSDKIDALEERVMTDASQEQLHDIRNIKKTLLAMNRHIWPIRDVASLMGKESTELIRSSTEPYIRDIYNHIVQVIDSTETCRELLSGLTDLHISSTSYKLNEIMKVLTIISTIFIPLTFLAGVYGMNFRYMPELGYRWGYGAVWVIMLVIAGLMVYYFKKKKWF